MTASTLTRDALPAELAALLADACACGCGGLPALVVKTDRKQGVRKGQRRRYIHGHNGVAAARVGRATPRRPRGRYSRHPAPGPWAWMCAACPWPLVSQAAQRPRGFHRHGGRGLCTSCYSTARRHGTLIDFERSTRTADEVLDEWEVLREQGYGRKVAAERLGVTLRSLDRVLERGRAAGDARAVWAAP